MYLRELIERSEAYSHRTSVGCAESFMREPGAMVAASDAYSVSVERRRHLLGRRTVNAKKHYGTRVLGRIKRYTLRIAEQVA